MTKGFGGILIAAGVLAAMMTGARADTTVTDIKGRSVSLSVPAKRIAIDDSRVLLALALIHPDPVSVLAAWPKDVKRIGPQTYDTIRQRFPAIEKLAQVSSSQDPFRMESVIEAAPDVMLVTSGRGPSETQIEQLQSLHIPVLYIDFADSHLAASMRLLGRLTDREARTEEFLAFRDAHLALIASRLGTDPQPVPVFFEPHAGISEECCLAPGKDDVNDLLRSVGGRSIASELLPGSSGHIAVEFIMQRDPKVYIATGGSYLERAGGLVLGAGYTPDRARESLARMAARRGISELGAVKSGRVHGLAQELLHSPLSVIATDALARWTRPDLFGDVDPAQTLAQINSRFLPFPLQGTYWIDLTGTP
ncbi:MAG TPA: ABC transporter substrate-binding protein [Candidatus Sulfotelmatobacter sp.]|nr:ABC transporter substrate-binding protein [Candidatus Sulfotelmatobacter sp.]